MPNSKRQKQKQTNQNQLEYILRNGRNQLIRGGKTDLLAFRFLRYSSNFMLFYELFFNSVHLRFLIGVFESYDTQSVPAKTLSAHAAGIAKLMSEGQPCTRRESVSLWIS